MNRCSACCQEVGAVKSYLDSVNETIKEKTHARGNYVELPSSLDENICVLTARGKKLLSEEGLLGFSINEDLRKQNQDFRAAFNESMNWNCAQDIHDIIDEVLKKHPQQNNKRE